MSDKSVTEEEVRKLLEYVKDNPEIKELFDKLVNRQIELYCALRANDDLFDGNRKELIALRQLIRECCEVFSEITRSRKVTIGTFSAYGPQLDREYIDALISRAREAMK